MLINSTTSNTSALNFSVLYASSPSSSSSSVSKPFLSTVASIEPSETTLIPHPTTTNLDIKCEPLAVHFDPWQQVPHSNATNALLPLANPDSIVTSIKTPLSTSIIHPPSIENINISKYEMKKPGFDEGGI